MAKKGNGKTSAEKVVKVKADFKKKAAEKAHAHQTKRLEFIAQYGKAIASAFAALGDKATSSGTWKKVFPKSQEPQRLTDYALVALGLKETTDKGLIAWRDADKLGAVATSQPKARKVKKVNGDAQVQA